MTTINTPGTGLHPVIDAEFGVNFEIGETKFNVRIHDNALRINKIDFDKNNHSLVITPHSSNQITVR